MHSAVENAINHSAQDTSLYFVPQQKDSGNNFQNALRQLLVSAGKRPLIFLCIGSDRATGDSLGPIIGQRLNVVLGKQKKAVVFGSLEQTVHAGNLSQTLATIQNRYSNPFIVAIDASLGIPEHTGCITLGQGCLHPGIGVNRHLPPAGDIHITGIVNHSSGNSHMALQTTRLSAVVELADFISQGILNVLREQFHVRRPGRLSHICPSLQCSKQGHFINIL
jgi:putative sporulation protein YyaC